MVRLISIFFVAFGIVLGGALMAGLGAVLSRQPPFEMIKNVAVDLRFWAIIGSIGGTFEALRGFEVGFLDGQIKDGVKTILYIISSFAGAEAAAHMIHYIVEGKWLS
jgi:hypothetical protein